MLYKLYSLDDEFLEEADDFADNFTGIVEWCSGTRAWYFDGKQHRFDGPAVEYYHGYKEWYIEDKRVTEIECKLLYDIMRLKGMACR